MFFSVAVQHSRELQELLCRPLLTTTAEEHLSSTPDSNAGNANTKQATCVRQQKFPESQPNALVFQRRLAEKKTWN